MKKVEQAKGKLDPATFAVLAGRMDTIVNATVEIEMTVARSLLVAECRDATSFVADKDGHLVSIAEGLPSHCAAGEFCVKTIAKAFEGDIHPGDLFIFNNPYMGNTHVGDCNIAAPVFFEGEHLFWMVNRSHLPDTGAYQPSTLSLYYKNKYEEGIHISPLRIHRDYKEIKDVMSIFLTNFRYPKTWYGDHIGQVAAVRSGEKRFQELCKKYGKDVIKQFLVEYNDYADNFMTEVIRKLPKGTWKGEDRHDIIEGLAPEGIRIVAELTIDPDDAKITVDLSESDDIVQDCGVNTTLAGATAGAMAAVLHCLHPRIPKTHGALKHVEVICREGSVAGGPIFPCGTSMGTTSIPDRIGPAIYRAFAKAVPERASSAPTLMNICGVAGKDWRKDYEPYGDIYYLGMGGGPAVDGFDGWPSYMDLSTSGVVGLSSVEVIEMQLPHFFPTVYMKPDTAGAGKYRGGTGAGYLCYGINTPILHIPMGDGQNFPPFGVFGGKEGALAEQHIIDMNTGKVVRDIPSSGHFMLELGQMWKLESNGGGGYGDPLERDPERVRWDAREGMISLAAARNVYGVVLDTKPEEYAVDYDSTTALRKELKAN
ncbi:MAG: hydantoinase B/oxoprolinase family protein [Smithella sp.]